MPDYQFNTNLGPAQQGSSLGDLVNMARGIQSYQQAAQLNPLQLQKAQMEIEQAQKLNPLAVQKATAEVGTAELGLNEKQAKLSHEMFGGLRNDPDILNAAKNPEAAVRKIMKFETLIENAGVPKSRIGPVSSYLMNEAIKNPTALTSHLDSLIQAGIGATGQQGLQLPDVVEVNGVKYNRNKQTGNLEPIGMARTAAPAVAPTAPTAPTAPNASVSQQIQGVSSSSLIRQDMPIAPGVIQMNAQQQARYDEGQKVQAESIQLAQSAQEAKQTTRKIKENIAAAAGSAPGQLLRAGGKWLAGNEQLDELVKNLADNQVRQAALMGGTAATDAARETYAKANGSENITPQALAQIVQRADASSTALEKFNMGLEKYYEKAGPYNAAIHTRNFKQVWSENYDPRIFMVQNINASDMSPAEKEVQLQLVMKGMTPEDRERLAKKATIIKRLEKGDF